MKKISMILTAMAIAAVAFTGCNKEPKGGDNLGINLDDVAEDGFYVYGAGVGVTEKLTSDYMMAVGINEVDKSLRSGMYEKYIYIEANKDFELVLLKGTDKTRYSATLEDYDTQGENDQPTVIIRRGVLKTGSEAPAMQVKNTGLYHIVLDINEKGDLPNAQIVLSPVEWGVSGGMNSWGYNKMDVLEASAKKIVWEIKDQKLPSPGEFKFKYGNGWKIQLDDAGLVKANTNLGANMVPAGNNITVDKAGLYDITLTYELKGGEIAKSYSYTAVCTQESTLPTTCYMIGDQFGNWDWASDGIVTLARVNGVSGAFWCIRWLDHHKGFKFCPVKEWSGDFTYLGEDSGYTASEGNCWVAEDGIYMIYVDFEGKKLCIEPAQVYGIGGCFGEVWDAKNEAAKYVADGQVMKVTATSTGVLRSYAESSIATSVWWTREWCIVDGAIVYRDGGEEVYKLEEYAGKEFNVEAGKTVVLDFNAGTCELQGESIKSPASGIAVGFSGGCFDHDTVWQDPLNAGVAVYDPESGDENPRYICQAIGINEGTFKLRINGGWISTTDITIEGEGFADDGSNDHNISCTAPGVYKVVITFAWNGSLYSGIKITFTPATDADRTTWRLPVSVSSSSWREGFIPGVQKYLMEKWQVSGEELKANTKPEAVSTDKSNDYWFDANGACSWDAYDAFYIGPYYGAGEFACGDEFYAIAYGKFPEHITTATTAHVDYVLSYPEKEDVTFSVTLYGAE